MSLSQSFTRNMGTRLISVVVAIVLWFVVLGSRSVEVTKEVPVEITTSDEMTVANEVPDKITFRLSGPKAFLRAILNRPESPIRVNLIGNSSPSVTFRFFSDNIRVPPGVKVMGVSPPAIQIKQEPVRTKEVRVRVDIRGTPPEGYRIVKVKIEPSVVKVRGAKSRLQNLSEISTLPIDVSEIRETTTQAGILEGANGSVRAEGVPPKVTLEVIAIATRYRIKNIPIKVLADSKVRLKERTVHLIVMSHFDRLKQLSSESLIAEVDLRGKAKGVYQVPVKVTLPKDVTLVRTVPSTVHVTLF